MSSNYFDDVGAFHVKFNLPVSPESSLAIYRPTGYLSETEFNFRTAFLFEELKEWIEAYGEQNVVKMADALVDLVWVALGTAHYLGIPFDSLWHEVKRANMEKRPWQEGDPIKPRNVQGFEVVKPEGWKPPDIEGIIERFRAVYGFR
jgi:predicted HAD superfamily Cof-like phosphohydrolase